jgi:carboxylesterase
MEENNPKKYNFFLQGGDQAVLLIHGITGTPSEMRYLGKSLNKAGFTVYCNTLPRHCDTLSELKKVTWQEIEESCIKDFEHILNGHRRVFVAGLSMGALMAIHLARKFPDKIAGIIALAPTFFYDGWALGKGKAVMEVVWHIPWVRNMINIREDWPFGLKDEDLRENIERFYKNARANLFSKKVFLFGSPFFPMANLYQHHQFTKVVIKEMAQVSTPILIIHARDDDMASLKNAQYLLEHIGSSVKRLMVLVNSYHMITIDNDKDKVVGEIITFINSL